MELLLANIPDILVNINEYTSAFLETMGIWGALISSLLITVESILPFLPLFVFITLNFLTFGKVLGFIISWICTCIGCYISFILFRTKIKTFMERKLTNKKIRKQIDKTRKYIDKISLSGLTILIAIPFTPAFVVNIASGLSDISKKKFLTSIIIGKFFMVYFWGYIGTTLIESLTHPIYLVKILLMILIAFVISKIVNKYFDVE